MSKQDLQQILGFKNGEIRDSNLLSKGNYKILNTFFKAIFSGEMNEYIYPMQLKAFEKWDTSHYEAGNEELVKEFQNRITGKIRLDSRVISVEETGDYVTIIYLYKGRRKRIFSKAAIVTPPAPITKKIVKTINKDTFSFLDSLKYSAYTVVAIGFKDVDFDDFSGICTSDVLTSGFLKEKTRDESIDVFLAYYSDEESKQLINVPDGKVIEQTVDIIHQLDIGNFTDQNILFADVHRWKFGYIIISEESYGKWNEEVCRASKRIFLAGDYLTIYLSGIDSAIKSGRETSERVKDFLKED